MTKTKHQTKLKTAAAVLVASVLASACSTSTTVVQPWERQYLAKPEMGWSADSLETALKDHTYFSKEGSSGGGKAAGGGCGCN